MRAIGIVSASVALVMGQFVFVAQADGVSSAATTVTVTGQLPSTLALPATVSVQLEVPTGQSTADPVPQALTDVQVASANSTDGSYSVTVPVSPAMTSAATNGIVEFRVQAVGGTTATQTWLPVTLPGSAAPASASTAMVVARSSARSRTFHVTAGSFAPVRKAPAKLVAAFSNMRVAIARNAATDPDIPIPIPCVWQDPVNDKDHSTRIGEMHVANHAGASGVFHYQTTADSSFSVGIQDSGANWSASGHVTVDNSLGAGETVKAGQGYLNYIDSDFTYTKYTANNSTSCQATHKVQATHANGDAFAGTATPPGAPFASCHANLTDNGHAFDRVGTNSSWSADHATSVSYDVVATAFGFGVSGHTGYTSTIDVQENNDSAVTLYVCGTKDMPNAPIVYEKAN
jgi:hypothetical protein